MAMTKADRRLLADRIAGLVLADPSRSSRSIAAEVGSTTATVIRYRRLLGDERPDVSIVVDEAPLPAPRCRCSRSMPDHDGVCSKCGRTVPFSAPLPEIPVGGRA
jgi:hypothetical protein